MPTGYTTVSHVTYTDYIIPNNINKVSINVVGARGENIVSLSVGCNKWGGRGASITASFIVGDYACVVDKVILKPGGTLRFVIGREGYNSNDPFGQVGGGGGGSAALYLAPGSSNWVILLVAGGGGGAGQFYNQVCGGFDGKDAELGESGGDGAGPNAGLGGSNGNGGFSGGIIAGDGGGGGGAFSAGQDGTRAGIGGKAGGNQGGDGGIFIVDNNYRFTGGFGFGGGGAGAIAGGGGGGYSGGGGGGKDGTNPGGGGGGGSYVIPGASDISKSLYGEIDPFKSFPAFASIDAVVGNPAVPVSLESSTLPGLQVAGCSLTNCVDFGYATIETATTLQAFTAAGGKIVSGGCSVNTITYRDSAGNGNPVKTVYRTYTVTDAGNNKAVAKQTINIVDPGVAATISPSSQVVCVNVKPATISLSVLNPGQFSVSVQWYMGPDNIFSDATIIQGANSLDYSPPATGVAGLTYYFGRITDGCGVITRKSATVSVGQPVVWYKDADNDNYSDPLYIGQPTCTKPGPNFKTSVLGTDCDDNDATYNPQTIWVHDADGDGYYSGSPYTGCLFIGATGYVRKTTQLPGDCNDSSASVHPGATEVLNGIDDNCNGQVDEGLCAVASNLTAINITQSSATLKWDSAFNGSKYNLSYKAANVSTWTVIKNIKKTTYNLTGLSSYYTYNYKVQTVCPFNDKSTYSKVSTFNTTYGGPAYCATKGNTYYEYIDRVVLGSAINNKSGDNNGYGDYNGINATVAAGGTYQIKLTPGFYSGIDTEYWEVYIDYNQDGLFKKQNGERVVTGRKSGTLSKNFTVPFTAKNGFTRMRVMMHYDSALNNPCSNFINGEAEDYTVIVTGGTAAIVASTDAGTSEAAKASNMSSILVVPNPVNSSSATAVLNMIKEGNASVRITDLSGRTLYKKDVTNLHTGKNPVALTGLASLTNGVYVIEAEQNGVIVGRAQVVFDK